MRGVEYGEFDRLVWMTMAEDGPNVLRASVMLRVSRSIQKMTAERFNLAVAGFRD